MVYNVFGSATPGADYQAVPNSLTIPAGQSSITVPIIAYEDNMAETPESIGISVQVDPCNKDTVYLYIRDRILQAPILNDTSACLPNTPIELLQCPRLCRCRQPSPIKRIIISRTVGCR